MFVGIQLEQLIRLGCSESTETGVVQIGRAAINIPIDQRLMDTICPRRITPMLRANDMTNVSLPAET